MKCCHCASYIVKRRKTSESIENEKPQLSTEIDKSFSQDDLNNTIYDADQYLLNAEAEDEVISGTPISKEHSLSRKSVICTKARSPENEDLLDNTIRNSVLITLKNTQGDKPIIKFEKNSESCANENNVFVESILNMPDYHNIDIKKTITTEKNKCLKIKVKSPLKCIDNTDFLSGKNNKILTNINKKECSLNNSSKNTQLNNVFNSKFNIKTESDESVNKLMHEKKRLTLANIRKIPKKPLRQSTLGHFVKHKHTQSSSSRVSASNDVSSFNFFDYLELFIIIILLN